LGGRVRRIVSLASPGKVTETLPQNPKRQMKRQEAWLK
jgi:hypothetical protein